MPANKVFSVLKGGSQYFITNAEEFGVISPCLHFDSIFQRHLRKCVDSVLCCIAAPILQLYSTALFKVTVSKDFFQFFSSINPTSAIDNRVKSLLYMVANSQRNLRI
jgi:hypothetical protein